jgi:hypothetical protein
MDARSGTSPCSDEMVVLIFSSEKDDGDPRRTNRVSLKATNARRSPSRPRPADHSRACA